MKKENFATALKAKELIGKAIGLFARGAGDKENSKLSLADLSDEALSCLIEDLEGQLTLDHSKEEG